MAGNATLDRQLQDPDSFLRSTAEFNAWLLNDLNVFIDDRIKIDDLRNLGKGRGLHTTRLISRNQDLFRIPMELVLSPITSSLPENCLEELDMNDPEREYWFKTILCLLHERSLGLKSKWAPYLAILPIEFDTPMFWTEEELAELQACEILNQIGKKEMDKLFETHLIPAVLKHPEEYGVDPEKQGVKEEVLHSFHVAGSTLMAYAFDLKDVFAGVDDSAEEDRWKAKVSKYPYLTALVPLADMMNAEGDDRCNCRLFYENGELVMKSTTPLIPGRELLNTYGDLDRATALRRYGYISTSYEPNDFVTLRAELLIEQAKRLYSITQQDIDSWTQKCLANSKHAHKTTEELYEPFEIELERCMIREIDITFFEDTFLLKDMISKPQRSKYKSSNGSHWWLHWFIETINARLAEYATTLEFDKSQLIGDGARTRLQTALRLRIGDKEILEGVKAHLGRLYNAPVPDREVDVTNEERRKKRRKSQR